MDEQQRQDRQLIELLNELRIALPGVQFLFAFLLTVPFAQGWKRVNGFDKAIFYATLLATTLSTICLIAPSATHRLRFHAGDRAYVIETAHKYTIAGLVFLALAIIGALVLITDVVYGSAALFLFPAAIALLLATLWFVRPLLRGGPKARR
jgi:Family of unknown function (DUF6328)